MEHAERSWRRFLQTHALHLILFAGLVARLMILWFYPAQNFPDSSTYFNAGRSLFRTGIIPSHVVMPLYPIISYLTGGGVFLKLLDIALSVATIWLMHALSLELFGSRTAALLAAAASALYPFFIFYSVNRLTETLYLFLLLASFLLLHRQRFLPGSIVLVLSILLRPTLDLLAPLLVLGYSWLVHRSPWRTTLRRLAIYLAVYILLMSPWWAHNFAKYGRFVRLNLGDGIVLYSGNNPLNRSGGGIGGVDVNLGLFRHITDPLERNAAMKQAAVDYIRQDPGHFVKMAAIKFLRFWRLWPYAHQYTGWEFIVVSLLSYGPVLLLALAFFAVYSWEAFRRIIPILLLFAYMTAVHMVTISSLRYRLPLEPFLIIFACCTVSRWIGACRAAGVGTDTTAAIESVDKAI